MKQNTHLTKVLALFMLLCTTKLQAQTLSLTASATAVSPGTSVTFTPYYTDPPIGFDILWFVNGTLAYDDNANSVSGTTPYVYNPSNGDVVYFILTYPSPGDESTDTLFSNTILINTSTTTWTGNSSTDLFDASNWSNGVPTSTLQGIIPSSASVQPALSANETVNNIEIDGILNINGHTLTINGTVTGTGTITVSPTSSIIIGGTAGTLNFTTSSDTLQNLTLNSNARATLGTQLNIVAGSSAGIVTIAGGAIITTGGYLSLLSDINGTARIAQSAGSISGSVTVQRYIPAKTQRKFSFIGSAVGGVTIRNAWQQQVYITGAGSGGTPCGSTTGDGVASTDMYNSSGFDVTQTNSPSMFYYAPYPTNGTHWTAITNTISTILIPGIGYDLNIRGNRNDGNCANQLESGSPESPDAVTLSATGTVGEGNVTVALNSATNASNSFTLLANPYPCPIDFDVFQDSNSTNLTGNLWLYSTNTSTSGGFAPGNYTTYNGGDATNAPTGYTALNNIESGQSFFVQSAFSGAPSVTFSESHKTTANPLNIAYFGISKSKKIRVGLQTNNNTPLDEVVVRYNNQGTKAYNANVDAVSLDEGSQVLVSLKGSKRLAIATHPLVNITDTTQLGITSSSIGTFSLFFSDYQGIDSTQSITLVDNFLNAKQDVRANQVYHFNVTSDTASAGNNRFELIVGEANPLPVKEINLTTTKLPDNEVAAKWTVVGESDVISYGVEHSADGKKFSNLTTVSQSVSNNYSFVDKNALEGINYYRIKAIDKVGIVSYSNVVSVKIMANGNQLTVYPNPAKDNVTIKGNHIESFQVIDNMGRVLKVVSLKDATNPVLSVSSLPPGVYHLRIETSDGNVSGTSIVVSD